MPAPRKSSAGLSSLPQRGASLLRKKDGTIFVRFRGLKGTPHEGRTVDRTTKAQTPGPAYVEAYALAERYERGSLDPWEAAAEVVTLEEAVRRWTKADPHISEATRKRRTQIGGQFVAHVGPTRRLSAVTVADVESFLYAPVTRAASGKVGARSKPSGVKASSTVRDYYARLRTFFGFAVKSRLLSVSPMPEVPKPKGEVRAPRVVTEAELEKLCRTVESDRYTKRAGKGSRPKHHPADWLPDWLRLAFYTGMRPGELRRLRWMDVDRRAGVLYVRNTSAGRIKTGKERPIPIYAVTATLLDRLAAARTNDDDTRPVIAPATGRLMNLNMVGARVRHYRKLAGLPDHIVPYSTRHGYASAQIEAGTSARVVQERMGHADGRMVGNYVHMIADRHAREESAFKGPDPVAAPISSTSPPHQSAGDCGDLRGADVADSAARRTRTKRNRPRRVTEAVSDGAEHRARTGDLNLGKGEGGG